ncbi:hypothetical protein KGV55_02835 [Candidatus Gracilibacteria bacterium]|nr:hypothetical protein [Candidatus Gracilibacteria bacterium]
MKILKFFIKITIFSLVFAIFCIHSNDSTMQSQIDEREIEIRQLELTKELYQECVKSSKAPEECLKDFDDKITMLKKGIQEIEKNKIFFFKPIFSKK